MPSIELSKLQAVSPARPVSDTDRTAAQATSGARDASGRTGSTGDAGISIEVAAPVDNAQPPVDNDRVAEIRQALRDGSYPLVPTQIADAMIAARHSFEAQS